MAQSFFAPAKWSGLSVCPNLCPNLCTNQSQKHRLSYFKHSNPPNAHPQPFRMVYWPAWQRDKAILSFISAVIWMLHPLFNAGLEVKRMCWIINMFINATWWAFLLLLVEARGCQRANGRIHYFGQKCHAKWNLSVNKIFLWFYSFILRYNFEW